MSEQHRLTPPSGPTLPTHCALGDLFVKTGASGGLYVGSATDTWSIVNYGAAGGFSLAPWNSGTTYSTNARVLDRDGIWQATGSNSNSRPISGNTNWTLVGGTPYVDVVLDPTALTTAPFYNPGWTIGSVNQGTKTFTVTASASLVGFQAGDIIGVNGSTGNDRLFTVASPSSATDVTVVEPIPDATGDGFIEANGVIVLAAPGANTMVVPLQTRQSYSVTSTGAAWDASPATVINWAVAETAGGTGVNLPSLPDALADDLSSVAPLKFVRATQSTAANLQFGLPSINRAVSIFTTAEMANGTRSVRYRFFYDIISVA